MVTPDEKRAAKEAETLENKYSLTFTKAELMEIFHALAVSETDEQKPHLYRPGVGVIIYNVLNKIKPFVVVESNITQQNHVEEPKEELDLGKN